MAVRGSSAFPGPRELGRGAVLEPGQDPPAELTDLDPARVTVDRTTVEEPWVTAEALREAWAQRRPVAVTLGIEPERLKQPESDDRPPFALDPAFAFPLEQLRLLVWANTYDLRSGSPTWWHGVLAERAGAASSEVGDVTVESAPVWIDGGPRGPLDLGDVGPVAIVHRESVAAGQLRETTDRPVDAPLADDQRAAVGHDAGAARVIAPAGSGKTRVLTARLRHLLADRSYEAALVTALAYNRRAAQEMRERLADLPHAHVRTLHALGFEIVRAGRPGVRLIGEREVRGLVEALAPVEPQPNTDVYGPYLEALAGVRLALVPPATVEAEWPDVPGFARLFTAYRDRLAADGTMDFDEQIYGAVEVLLRHPGIRARFQARCQHLLVDEFQDLTPAMLLMVRLLAAPAWQVYGVGDDDQVIYGHAGADPTFLVDYERFFPHATHHALEVNYRNPPPVVDAAATLLSHNRLRVAKTIRAGRDDHDAGDLRVCTVDNDQQAATTVDLVRDLLDDGAEPEGIAVLCRVNAMLLPVQLAMAEAGIASTSPVSQDVLTRTGVRVALAWLRLATAPDGQRAGRDLAEVARRSPRKLRGPTLSSLAARGPWSRRQLTRVAFDQLEVWEGKELRALADDLETVAKAARRSTAAALAAVRDVGGLDESAQELDRSAPDHKRTASHIDDLNALTQVAALHPDAGTFGGWLAAMLGDADDRGSERVQLSTIHAVKGLEFDHVVLVAVDRGLMPHRLSTGREQLEEERRVFHVAITRGIQTVTVVADREEPSPYLEQMRRPTSRREETPARP